MLMPHTAALIHDATKSDGQERPHRRATRAPLLRADEQESDGHRRRRAVEYAFPNHVGPSSVSEVVGTTLCLELEMAVIAFSLVAAEPVGQYAEPIAPLVPSLQ